MTESRDPIRLARMVNEMVGQTALRQPSDEAPSSLPGW